MLPWELRSGPLQDSDLGPADALIVASINDLTTRHGYGPIAKPSSPRFQRFSLNDDPEGLWVAESDGRLIGFGHSWTCDRLWFLAQLFVQPDLQASGVGRELLAKTELARENWTGRLGGVSA